MPMLDTILRKVNAFPNKYERFCALERVIAYPSNISFKNVSSDKLIMEYDDLDKFFEFKSNSQFRMIESERMKRNRERNKKKMKVVVE